MTDWLKVATDICMPQRPKLPRLRTAWSMVGRTLIRDQHDRQVISPASDIGSTGWHRHKDEWEAMAPLIVRGVNADLDHCVAKLKAVQDELLDRIDGADESRGYDGWLSMLSDELQGVIDRLEGPGR